MTTELTYTQEQRMNRLVNRVKFNPLDMLALARTYYEANGGCWNEEDYEYLDKQFGDAITAIVGKVLQRDHKDKVWVDGPLVEFEGEMVQTGDWDYDGEWADVDKLVTEAIWVRMHNFINRAAETARLVTA